MSDQETEPDTPVYDDSVGNLSVGDLKDHPRKTVTLKVTQQDTMPVEVYESQTKGLVIHRQVRWSPGKEEYKFTSKWQITHEASGLGLLSPTKCMERSKDAFKFCKRLKEVRDWDLVTVEQLTDDENLLNKVKNIYEGVIREQEAESRGEIVVDEEYTPRFVIIRNRKTKGYDVVEDATKKVISTHSHRGTAWREAHRLNEQAT